MTEPIYLTVGPNEPDNITLGNLIKSYRHNTKKSRLEFAESLELSSEYIRLIEIGKRAPVLGLMAKLLIILDISYVIVDNETHFEGYVVKFTSRIQEARRKSEKDPQLISDRDKKIGQIIRLMVTVDDSALHDIHRRLLHEYRSR